MFDSIRKTLLMTSDPYRRVDLIWRSRVHYVASGKGHLQLAAGAKIFLHLIPLSSEPFSMDKRNQELNEQLRNLQLLSNQYPSFYNFNIDGFFGFNSSGERNTEITSYYQIFWDGSIEFCHTIFSKVQEDGSDKRLKILLPNFESQIFKCIETAVYFLKSIEVPLPIRIGIAMVGMRGSEMHANQYTWLQTHLVDRDDLFLTPITIANWDIVLNQSLRPLFDLLWNAGGFSHSSSYDENGDRKPNLVL